MRCLDYIMTTLTELSICETPIQDNSSNAEDGSGNKLPELSNEGKKGAYSTVIN